MPVDAQQAHAEHRLSNRAQGGARPAKAGRAAAGAAALGDPLHSDRLQRAPSASPHSFAR